MKLDDLLIDEAKHAIKESLGLDEKSNLDEAFAAQPKKFSLKSDFLSDANIQNHMELYKDYIKKFNKASTEIDSIDNSTANSNHSAYRAIKIDETYNMNSAYLHELFFSNIGDSNSTISMDTLSYMRLNRDFGSFDKWQRDFIACAKSVRNGWVITYLNMYTQSYMNCAVDLHSQNVPAGMYPVVVMDMWEHSYYRDYLGETSTYLSAMMKQLNWNVIEKRFEKADKILSIVRGH